MGPMKLLGTMFGVVGTSVQAVERVVVNTDSLIQTGFDAIDLAVDGGMEDLKTDKIVEDANRRVRRVTAETEADAIIAKLEASKKDGDA